MSVAEITALVLIAFGLAAVVGPSRAEVQRWREQRRNALAQERARDIAHFLTEDLAVAQALDELDIARTARTPSAGDNNLPRIAGRVEGMCDYWNRELQDPPLTAAGHAAFHLDWRCPYRVVAEILRGNPDPRRKPVAQALNDGYRA